jgi:hypothetical protein
MNIPLDNLYHWIQGVAQHPVMLYVFHPHGSKDIFNLRLFREYGLMSALTPAAICHDQEPLNFSDHVFDHDMDRLYRLLKHRRRDQDSLAVDAAFEEFTFTYAESKSLHRNYPPTWLNIHLSNDWTILLHSEINSKDVDQFSQVGFSPVYYWSHAVIARDWYRFAQHDVRLTSRDPKKTFLIYCRDWTPNREYRLKFLDLVVQQNLTVDCVISTQHVNNQGMHLKDYQATDPRFAFDAGAILNSVHENTTSPSSSADYDADDVTSTRASVVLETVVDSSKIHLTEKTLRPIACAHPFVLAAGPGALKYLHGYGFKTFGDFWDESYDDEADTVLRLEKIINTMRQIQNLSPDDWQKIQCIADYNQQHFFSEEFMNQVTNELAKNLNQALDFCNKNCGENYWRYRKFIRRTGFIKELLTFKSEGDRQSIRELRRHRYYSDRTMIPDQESSND